MLTKPLVVLAILFPVTLEAQRVNSLPPDATSAPAIQLGDAFAAVADRLKGSVVSVLSERVIKQRTGAFPFPFGGGQGGGEDFFDKFFGQTPGGQRRVPVAGLGSGFVVDDHGHILTNSHVVEGMEKIHVVLPNKQTMDAKVLGIDPPTDMALIELKGTLPKDLTVASLGDSDSLKSGHLVMAFGAPFGLTQTVTSGIISATGRADVGIADFEDFIQTDAPINPGNSGGPLVNMRGEVIGINTAIATSIGQSAGVGFAIPINMAKDILPTLLQGKSVQRGMLGTVVQDLTPALAKQFGIEQPKGALIAQVNNDSPAQRAGIRSGDIIVKFGGKSIDDSRRLRELVSRAAPGTKEDIELIRNGKQEKTTVQLGALSTATLQASSQEGTKPDTQDPLAKFGAHTETLNPQIAKELRLKDPKGLVVADVEAASPAGMAGLRPGDVISEVDRQKVDSNTKAGQVLAKSGNPDEALLLVKRDGNSIYVTLQTG